jgi:hypothetical protein
MQVAFWIWLRQVHLHRARAISIKDMEDKVGIDGRDRTMNALAMLVLKQDSALSLEQLSSSWLHPTS